jgi:hypothetical protein
LVLSGNFPHWQAFALGMGLVHKVGLFDEGYYPAYFEDIEYLRRMGRKGLEPEHGPDTFHDNSSTLNTPHADFRVKNGSSWESNRSLFDSDRPAGFDPYRWRALGWL